MLLAGTGPRSASVGHRRVMARLRVEVPAAGQSEEFFRFAQALGLFGVVLKRTTLVILPI